MKDDKSPINIMVDKETKENATKIFDDLGISMSTAISMYLRQIIKNDGLPFKVRNNSNKEILDAIKEAQNIINNSK